MGLGGNFSLAVGTGLLRRRMSPLLWSGLGGSLVRSSPMEAGRPSLPGASRQWHRAQVKKYA